MKEGRFECPPRVIEKNRRSQLWRVELSAYDWAGPTRYCVEANNKDEALYKMKKVLKSQLGDWKGYFKLHAITRIEG